ncbi:MAG TPA: Ku protein [Candidatus Sulfotelmatobacter sp.]|nr:Ku protein [Candidatus Sulfotelmatobacter sp.]
MPSALWKGHITFGLISIPVRLFAAAREAHTRFHEIHRECGARIHHQLYCPYDERVVTRQEVALGYETDKDKFVLVEPSELKKIQPKSSKVMEILQFAKLEEVDPIYFETSYFCVPEEAGRRAYDLLLSTLEHMKYVAVARIAIHQRERVVIVRPYLLGLTMHTIYYPNEIRKVEQYKQAQLKDLRKQEITLGEQFAKTLVKPFRPEEYRDEYETRVQQLIESKAKGHAAPRQEHTKHLAPVIDLMSALKKSLANAPAGKTTKPKKLRRTA